MINNLEHIKPLLEFSCEDDFYYLQILSRKKDNPDLGRNSRVIKNYYINSVEYLERKMPEIIDLCTLFNARASLRLNKRSYRKVAFKAIVNLANTVGNDEYVACKAQYDKACGQSSNEKNDKRWIVDIDEEDIRDLTEIKMWIRILHSKINDSNRIHVTIPSASGFHIICNPFNLMEFKSLYTISIHKDSPTNLYIP